MTSQALKAFCGLQRCFTGLKGRSWTLEAYHRMSPYITPAIPTIDVEMLSDPSSMDLSAMCIISLARVGDMVSLAILRDGNVVSGGGQCYRDYYVHSLPVSCSTGLPAPPMHQFVMNYVFDTFVCLEAWSS